MAATFSSKRAFATAPAPTRSRTVRVCCQNKGDSGLHKAAFASLAAAALLSASPVHAGVILQQPTLKKVLVTEDAPAAPAPKKSIVLPKDKKAVDAKKAAAPAAPAAKPAPSVVPEGGEFDFRGIALPASLVVLAGGWFVLTKIDDGFEAVLVRTAVKDSNRDGAGYEVQLKDGGAAALGKKSPGTKKVKAATKSSAAPSPLSSLSSIFGSKDE